MKKHKIIFWITTLIIFVFEGVMPALTFNTPMAKAGISSLGYPEYFGYILVVFKVLGSLGLIIPAVKGHVKEWVYAGFGFDFVFAFLSLLIVGGVSGLLIIPLVCMILLILSYRSYHKLQALKAANQM